MVEQAPSKIDLLERRAERDLIRQGKTVLEERRDLLAHRVLVQISVVDDLAGRAGKELERSRRFFRLAASRHGIPGLRAHARRAADSPSPDPVWELGRQLGVAWLTRTGDGPADEPPEISGDGDTSLELEAARASLRRLLAHLVALAVARSNLARLVSAFQRIQRRVSALEHVVLPETQAAIRRIEESLDELDRDDLARALLIKRRHGRDRPEPG